MKKLLVVAIALIITGCVCVTGAFAAVGWDADRFDLAGTTPRVFTAEGTVTAVDLTNLDGLDASAARLATGNATIRGTLVGRRSEYTLLLTASNGSCEPGSGGDGPRRFEATTTNGNIRIQFES